MMYFRVDMALGSQQHEQGKAVFLGNLDFKTSEDDIRQVCCCFTISYRYPVTFCINFSAQTHEVLVVEPL
jgi:hypothetical protein